MCNFKIGQRVVFIGEDLSFDPNPGKTIHVIKGIRQSCCSIEIDVGIPVSRIDSRGIRCGVCGGTEVTNIWWKREKWFRPLINDYTESEIESVHISELLEPLHETV